MRRAPFTFVVPAPNTARAVAVSKQAAVLAGLTRITYYVTPNGQMVMRYGVIGASVTPPEPPAGARNDIVPLVGHHHVMGGAGRSII